MVASKARPSWCSSRRRVTYAVDFSLLDPSGAIDCSWLSCYSIVM